MLAVEHNIFTAFIKFFPFNCVFKTNFTLARMLCFELCFSFGIVWYDQYGKTDESPDIFLFRFVLGLRLFHYSRLICYLFLNAFSDCLSRTFFNTEALMPMSPKNFC